ncbi:hypothetical protein EJB05_17265 [Eragrostis curvula]|uniref:Jacalin-type lectin domain-containing protein n=1 Tax=Eragrostis curvula TaxID=38414 RepID=A0A5J9VI34_9POAL|nr:hypothetical protein EJB05_17265 [Eragrostis curvula]
MFLSQQNDMNTVFWWFPHQQPAHQRRMVASSKVIRVGPWGGRGGSPWDDGPHRGVRSITLAYSRFLESMTVEYVDRSGRPVYGEKHGGGTSRSRSEKVPLIPNQVVCARSMHVSSIFVCNGQLIDDIWVQIELDFPYEFVTGVSGRYQEVHVGSLPVVRSLTFTTSRGKVHGPFGYDEGTPFAYPMEGGVVVGFTGRSSWHVDALGLYVAALRPETLCDVVHERGLSAYRSFVYGGGGARYPQQQQQQQQQYGTTAQHHQAKRPFEWCYK